MDWLSWLNCAADRTLDYLEAGMPIEKIMLKGGWHSGSTVIQYLRAWEDI
jgi:hypothetical protein